jgi:hypothetical protein
MDWGTIGGVSAVVGSMPVLIRYLVTPVVKEQLDASNKDLTTKLEERFTTYSDEIKRLETRIDNHIGAGH